jgi:hypothetical protein
MNYFVRGIVYYDGHIFTLFDFPHSPTRTSPSLLVPPFGFQNYMPGADTKHLPISQIHSLLTARQSHTYVQGV